MGFALSTMTAEEASDALAALGAEREAEDREAAAKYDRRRWTPPPRRRRKP